MQTPNQTPVLQHVRIYCINTSFGEFKRLLKTHLFGDQGALRNFSEERRFEIILLTYLQRC